VSGSIAKLWLEDIEAVDPRPVEALTATGASRVLVWRYGLLPMVAPGLASVLLYMWEFNIRSSTVLGLVGAGGIGQQLKNAVDLLDFARVVPIVAVILVMVALVDGLSAFVRRRLVST
jgi:phosphonate transport system permease protein